MYKKFLNIKVFQALGLIVAGLILGFLLNSPLLTYPEIKSVDIWYKQPILVKDIDLEKEILKRPGMTKGYVTAWDVGVWKDKYGLMSVRNNSRIILLVEKDLRGGGACDGVNRYLYSEGLFPGKSVPSSQILNNEDYDSIPSLDFPGYVANGKEIYVRDSGLIYPCDTGSGDETSLIFFNNIKKNLTPYFIDPVLGRAYVDKKEGGIVFRTVDNSYIRYKPVK